MIFGIALIVLRYLMLEYHLPGVFKQLDLFQPHHFAISMIIPSLGDLLIHSAFVFFFICIYYENFNISFNQKKTFQYVIVSVFIILSFLFFNYVNYFFESLILHSSISFLIYKFFDLSIYSLIGFVIITLLLSALFLFIDRFSRIVANKLKLRSFILLFALITAILILISNAISVELSIYSIGFYIVLVLVVFIVRIKKEIYTYALRILLLLLFALFTVLFITVTSSKKDRETRKVLAVNLSNEHDQIAEMLLVGIEEKIQKDTVVRDLLTWHLQNEGVILEHLQMTYFSGYFRKFDLEISVCNPNDNLILLHENSTEIVHCYNFFSELFES
ncbi:MAG: hypothetical protein KAQ75_01170, partial [Bacteroidales bacterium]|nr:hypothetical protein [Bacteroidales bacterium]